MQSAGADQSAPAFVVSAQCPHEENNGNFAMDIVLKMQKTYENS